MYSPSSESGVIFTGTRYGLYIEPDKTTYVLDFRTGARTLVEGLLYSGDHMTISANSAGTKILFAMFDRKADGLGMDHLGVINVENNTFTLLNREGYEIREETAVGWFDEERISILAESSIGEKYLYLYSFVK